MNRINKLFDVNQQTRKCNIKEKCCRYISNSDEFGAQQIYEIIAFVNGVHMKYKKVNVPIYLCFNKVNIIDKLSYIILECICYSLINDFRHSVSVLWKPNDIIQVQGVFSSPLALLNNATARISPKYLVKFSSEIYGYHFRKVVSEDKSNTNYLGNIQQEVNSFLSTFYIEEDYKDDIVEVIGEIVGNAIEHTETQCLLDIDVTKDYSKSVESVVQKGVYYGINIVVLNFSDILIGDGIKNRIEEDELKSNDRYISLQNAYEFHKSKFDNDYTYDDFCNISSMQHKISGDMTKGKAGGRGLTTLIKSLQEKSDTNNCYILSGKRILFFEKELLQYDENQWLGFNESKDFFTDIPDEAVVNECIVNFPGTAYNLNFILKREEGHCNEEN